MVVVVLLVTTLDLELAFVQQIGEELSQKSSAS